jgi:myo-inositol-1(or 4)-monophosphatase
MLPSRVALETVAVRAGVLALGHLPRALAERKPDRTLVTQADRDVEAFLASELSRLMPDASIVGEEGATRTGPGPYRIVIDPIDGTSAFISALPTWCVAIGILAGAEPVAGVVYLPATGETYSARDGRAWWNGSPLPPLAVSRRPSDPFVLVHSKAHLRHRLAYPGKVRSLGSTAYHVALVARGAADAALIGRPHLWDVVAPGALLAAVGGRYEYLSGEPLDLLALIDGHRARDHVLAGLPRTLSALRAMLGPA